VLLHWFKSLFIDELRVLVHPQRLVLLRLKRSFNHGLKQQLVHQQVVELQSDSQTSDSHTQTIVENLKQVLAKREWQRVMPVIVMSNHFVRYSVIPWNIELTGVIERQAYLKHCFNLFFGESTKLWDFRMSEPEFGQSSIASAISSPLLTALHNVFEQSNLKIAAIYPQLMLAINQTLSEVKKQKIAFSFWLIVIQSERVCLTLLIDGGWRLVKNVAIEADISAQVTALIQREIVNSNMNDDMPVLLYWPESKSHQPLKLANQNVVKVPPRQFYMQNSQALSSLPDWLLI
jgi:hypothetical protein